MEPSSSPERTEDAGSSPQSYTSLRFAPIERPVTPPASFAKQKDSTPDDTKDEETRGPIPDEAAKSPADNPRVSPPANSSASQPGPRPRRSLPNSPIRRRDSRPRNSPIRRRGASVNQRNGHSSNERERENIPVARRILPRLGKFYPVSQTSGDLSRQTVPLIAKKPTLFLAFPNHSITPPDGQNPDITPRYFPFHTIDVPTPPTVRGGPKGTLELIMRTSPYEPDYVPDWRVNAFWKDNVERVLGREVRDNWPDMMALIREAKASFLEKGDPLIQRGWNPTEIEIAAGLKAWRMPDFVIGYLIGQPPRDLGIRDKEQFGLWGFDEMNRMDGVNGMGGFGNSEEEEEEVAEGSDQVGEEREEKTDKEEEAGEEKEKGMETEEEE